MYSYEFFPTSKSLFPPDPSEPLGITEPVVHALTPLQLFYQDINPRDLIIVGESESPVVYFRVKGQWVVRLSEQQ